MGLLGLLFPLAGAFLGGAFGGPVGVMWGWAIGSTIGSLLSPQKVEGPRLSDLSVQTSTYGTTIPIVYGRARIAGNVIWSTDLQERAVTRTVSSGGFFIFSSKMKITEYKYSASFAVALCEGPIDSVARIWLDTKLRYDVRDSADDTTRERSQAWANKYLTIHLGGEGADQDPDPFLAEKITNLPAHRGMAYLVLKNLDLEDFGNRIPNLTVEVVRRADVLPDHWEQIDLDATLSTWFKVDRWSHAAVEFQEKLWAIGGWNARDGALSSVGKSEDGSAWNPGVSLGAARYSIRAVVLNDKLWVIGGADDTSTYEGTFDAGGGSDMVTYLEDESGGWQTNSLTGDGSVSDGRGAGHPFYQLPFPREGYAMAVHDSGYPLGKGIFFLGGHCYLGAADSPPGKGPYDSYQDLWFSHNGTTWQRLNETGGAGYRAYATMLSFNGDLYLFGGTAYNPGGIDADTWKKYVNGCFRYSSGSQQFVQIAGNITGDFDDVIVSGAVWRNRMIALVSHSPDPVGELTSDNRYFLWESSDGVTWIPLSKAVFDIYDITGSYTFRISGDKTDTIEAGDWLSFYHDSTFLGPEYPSEVKTADAYGRVQSITYDGSTGLTTVTIQGTAIYSAANRVYVHAVSGDLDAKDIGNDANILDTQTLTNFGGTLYVVGGGDLTKTTFDQNEVWKTSPVSVSANQISLADIVEDLSARAGLSAGDIDATELRADMVDGYVVKDRKTVREAIEPLQRAFFFDAVESDGKVRFVKRGGSSVVTISDADLAAHRAEEDLPDKAEYTRGQEMELPDVVNVNFLDVNRDYQEGTQTAQRIVGEGRRKVSVNLPIVMTPSRARQIAEVLLYDAWLERSSISFRIGPEYLYLDPADVITLTVENRSFTVRITKMNYSLPGVIQCDGVVEAQEIYSIDATGVEGQATNTGNNLLDHPEVEAEFLDIPILSSRDDDYGFYLAVHPAAGEDETRWIGANVYVSLDGGQTYGAATDLITHLSPAGTAQTVLAPADPALWDRGNTVTVVLTAGSLSSMNEDQILSGEEGVGRNTALLGDEIIHFATAELVGTKTYRLSNLLRGRFGTEWAMNQHAVGERFVVLDGATRLNLFPKELVGTTLKWKIFPAGGVADSATAVEFTNTAIGKKPWAPTHVTGRKTAKGNWVIEWIRRSRLGGDSARGAPLGEAFERYEVDILDGSGNVLRTLEVEPIRLEATVSAIYWKEWQIEDFGQPVTHFHVQIYQISEDVGRGYPAEAILTV